jgi:hypothetical protein
MFPHDVGNHIVEFHISDKARSTSRVAVTNKSTRTVFVTDIDVWSPLCRCDYFMRYFVVDTEGRKYTYPEKPTNPPTYIVFTSYEGLTVWNMDLEEVYHRPIEDQDKYNDVYGCDISKDDHSLWILSWSYNTAQSTAKLKFPVKEYEDLRQEYEIRRGQIGSKILKRRIREMRLLRQVDYISCVNVDQNLVLKQKIS